MITEKQQKKNDDEIKWYDDMISEQRGRITKFFEFDIDSALEYKCSETTVDDWQDTCETSAEMIIQLQRHAKKVADHLQVLSTYETTKDLRAYTMNRFDVSSFDSIY